MHARVVPIATHVGPHAVIKHQENGLLVDHSIYALANAMQLMMSNNEQRNKLAFAAYQMIKRNFSFDKTRESYHHLFQSMCKKDSHIDINT